MHQRVTCNDFFFPNKISAATFPSLLKNDFTILLWSRFFQNIRPSGFVRFVEEFALCRAENSTTFLLIHLPFLALLYWKQRVGRKEGRKGGKKKEKKVRGKGRRKKKERERKERKQNDERENRRKWDTEK